jgi:hypothetical protein
MSEFGTTHAASAARTGIASGLIAGGVALGASTAAGAGLVAGSPGIGVGTFALAELRVDQLGADTDEYAEIVGAPFAPLTGWWLLAIGDGGTDPAGVVEMAIDLSAWSTGANGRFVAHESTFGTGVLEGRTLAIDPMAARATVGSGDAMNLENADTVTYLLVRGFTGSSGMDLDAGNDGTLDLLPWLEIGDAVALVGAPGTDPCYAAARVGPVATTGTGGMPAHAWKDAGGAWQAGAYASWSWDTPGRAPDVPAPGPGALLGAAAAVAHGYHRRRRE